MRYLPAICHALALAIALCVQSLGSPLCGAWLLFAVIGCVAMYEPNQPRNALWYALIAWMLALGASTFLLAPVANGAATMWLLFAMPMLALAINKSQLKNYLISSLVVLTGYALVLIWEMVCHVQYTNYGIEVPSRLAWASCWPLLDPNNAACIMNIGLIPCFYLGLRDKRWFTWAAVFAFALYGTNSRTGGLCAFIGCFVLLAYRYPKLLYTIPVASILATIAYCKFGLPSMPESLLVRSQIIHASLPLFSIRPLSGLGLGTFSYYYSQIRTESVTAGVYLHNDTLQLMIEMGIPCIIVFLTLWISAFIVTTKSNIISLAVLLAVFLHSMMEFQFYLPAISMLTGVALAYHRLNSRALAS